MYSLPLLDSDLGLGLGLWSFFGLGPLGASEGDFHEISTFPGGCAAPSRGPRRIKLCGPLFVFKPLFVIRFAVFVTISRRCRDPPRVGETPGFGPLGASEGDFYGISIFAWGCAASARGRAALSYAAPCSFWGPYKLYASPFSLWHLDSAGNPPGSGKSTVLGLSGPLKAIFMKFRFSPGAAPHRPGDCAALCFGPL